MLPFIETVDHHPGQMTLDSDRLPSVFKASPEQLPLFAPVSVLTGEF
jgi:hypothetical protein